MTCNFFVLTYFFHLCNLFIQALQSNVESRQKKPYQQEQSRCYDPSRIDECLPLPSAASPSAETLEQFCRIEFQSQIYKQIPLCQVIKVINKNLPLKPRPVLPIIISFKMDLKEEVRPQKMYNVIQPNTTRVLQKRRQRMQKQLQKRTQEQKLQKERQENDRRNESIMKLKEHEKRIALEKMAEQKRRLQQEADESNTLSGKFGHMINDLNTNTTNHQFSISGMDLRPAQIKVLVANVQKNASLKGLNMCRKNLTDVEGCQVADNLLSNVFLERLELEGNRLGPETLTQISKLLKTNESLRLIDLQGNKLIQGTDDKLNYKGIQSLMQALKINETLLSLNLNGTGLDRTCSGLILQMMEYNSSLILLDLGNNPEMDIDDVQAIQDALLRNKQDYDDERYMEFIERKRMRREEDISGVVQLNNQTKKLRSEAIDLNISTKKVELDQEWTQFLASEQIKRQKEIVRMEKQAALKKGKKGKKK